MKRTLMLCLFLIICETSGQCATPMFSPLQPLQPVGATNSIQNYSSNVTSLPDPFARPVTTPNVNYSNINQIEQTLFGRMYANQDISARLSRIEKSLFTTTYPNATNDQRIDNIISNFNQINKYPNISTNALSKLESKVFSQSYPQYNPERRIERLEQQILGTVQSGDLNSRYEKLMAVAKTYSKNNQYDPNNIATQGRLKSLAANLGNSFWGGSMTGFTPQIDSFPNNYTDLGGMDTSYTGSYTSYNNGPLNPYMGYSNGYNNYNGYPNPYARRYGGMSRGGGPGYGYYNGSRSYGSGTGVTILD